jgi:hypothetical protein
MKAKTSIVLLKVLFAAFILVGIMQFIFAAVKSIPVSLETYLFALRLPIDVSNPGLLEALRWYIFICAVPLYLLCLYAIYKLVMLLKPLAESRIFFTEQSVVTIKHIGYACWVYAIFSPVIEFVSAKLLPGIAQSGWGINFSLPVLPAIAGVIILSLAEVCNQGFALKQDNDSIV